MNKSESAYLRYLCRGESTSVVVRLIVSDEICLPANDLLLFAKWTKEEGDLKSSQALCLMAIKVSRNILAEAIDLLQDG